MKGLEKKKKKRKINLISQGRCTAWTLPHSHTRFLIPPESSRTSRTLHQGTGMDYGQQDLRDQEQDSQHLKRDPDPAPGTKNSLFSIACRYFLRANCQKGDECLYTREKTTKTIDDSLVESRKLDEVRRWPDPMARRILAYRVGYRMKTQNMMTFHARSWVLSSSSGTGVLFQSSLSLEKSQRSASGASRFLAPLPLSPRSSTNSVSTKSSLIASN